MIVVDTNVIAYLCMEGKQTEAVRALRKKDADWIAPRLWIDEFLNVLATAERHEVISAEVANETLALACELMDGKSYDVPAQHVLSVARRTGCTAYDAQYVCLAEDLGVKLYTYDKQVLRKCKGVALRP